MKKLSVSLIRQTLGLLDRTGKRKLALFTVANFFISLFDVLGVAAILPLVQVMAGQGYQEGYLKSIHEAFGYPPREQFVIVLAAVIVLAFATKTAAGLTVTWYGTKLATSQEVALQDKLLRAFLDEPYSRHRTRSTAEIVRTVGPAVKDAYGRIITGVMQLISQGLSVMTLGAFMIVVVPIPTVAAVAFFALAMIILDVALGPYNRRAGKVYLDNAGLSNRALIEASQGFREIRMHNKQSAFIDRFSIANGRAAEAGRRSTYSSSIPKHVLEVVAITGIALVLTILAWTQSGGAAIGSLALFVGAAIKILPNLAAISHTLTLMHRGTEGAALVLESINEFNVRARPAAPESGSAKSCTSVSDSREIVLRDISFKFPDAELPTLSRVNLTIPHGSTMAICGSSGSGKTTLVDIIIGLQSVSSGSVTYGGEDIGSLGASWRDRIGYLPQDVFLLDDSIAANVAFGATPDEHDIEMIQECLEMAQLSDLMDEMPDGINTRLGERGVRLSGGQRQRIGIARALYSNPTILVLDEATSALDNETEHSIVQTIAALARTRTVIVVAHRLSTVRNVDELVFLEEGTVTARGTFDEVRKKNARFSELVRLGDLGREPIH